AFPTFTSLVETELSANKILEKVKEMGFEIRRQTGLDIIGALRNNVNAARQFRTIAHDVIPDPSKFGTALTNLLSKFHFKVEIKGEGIGQPDYITVRSNVLLSKDQILNDAR